MNLKMDVSTHKNVENVIRYFLIYLPPRGAESILDVGGGCFAPYKGVLQTRCAEYKNIDIRPGINVDYVQNILEGTSFKDKQWDWVWCSETLEHIPQQHMKKFVDEVCRISKNILWTFPLPHSPSFPEDPGHSEVIVDMNSYSKDFQVFDKTTKTGRGIWIFARKDRKVEITKSGIIQEGYSPDNLPFKVVKNKMVKRTDNNKNIDKFFKF